MEQDKYEGRSYLQKEKSPTETTRYGEVHMGANIVGDDLEFIKAVEKYKRRKGVVFLRETEYLEIARRLGYHK